MSDVTQILSQIAAGDPSAVDQLLPLVYAELRTLAAAKMSKELPGQTLQPTALVHEAYIRLLGPNGDQLTWENRGHFLSAAATAMRRILIERARYKQRQIHGGDLHRVGFSPEEIAAPEPDARLLALDGALQKLATLDPQKARLVELRYFAGLTGEETAKVLGISATTVDRHWTYARAWLRREIMSNSPSSDEA